MSIATVITQGIGPGASVPLVVTDGYAIGAAILTGPVATAQLSMDTYKAELTLSVYTAELSLDIYDAELTLQ